MPKHHSVSLFSLLLMIACGWFTGCQSMIPSGGLMQREVAKPLITDHQLRVMVNEFVVYSARRIELRADEILAETNDVAIRKNALLWKINGIAACFQAGSRHDPLGAFIDVWVLNRQMLKLAESPNGNTLFGPYQSKLTEEYLAFDDRLQDIKKTVSSDIPIAEKIVNEFANEFPLTGLYFDREPIASRYIEEIQSPSTELLQVVANLDSNIDDLRKLTILYAEHLPKQARWEAELMLLDVSQSFVLRRPLQDFSTITDAVTRIADTTQLVPQLVECERRILGEMVSAERQVTLQEFEQMRRNTVLQLETERSIVLDAVRQERETILASLRDERIAVTDEFSKKVTEALQATDTITQKRSHELVLQAPKVIDHFFWRATQFSLLVICLVGVLAVLYVHKKTNSSTISRVPEASSHRNTQFPRVYEDQQNRAA